MTTGPSAGVPADLDAQAGEYVLGTLSADARRAIDARLPHDAALRDAVGKWEERFLPLAGLVAPEVPPETLWQRIERGMGSRSTLAAGVASTAVAPANKPSSAQGTRKTLFGGWSGWNNLDLWRALAGGSFATAATLAVVLATRVEAPASAPQYMVVLVAPQDKAPGWVIQAGMSRQISLIPLATAIVPQDKALQFWTKADDWSGPVSLGLVKPGESTRIALDRLPPLQPNQLFELTLEPAAGSPIGKPTGPIQFIGRAVKVM